MNETAFAVVWQQISGLHGQQAAFPIVWFFFDQKESIVNSTY
jgi:hypothetical protein